MDIRPDGVSEPSSPRLGLDDLGLRLDRPLFARDPGIGNTPSSPNLRELTWDYVVKPANDGSPPPSAPPDDQPVVKPVRIEDLLSEPSAAAALLRRDEPLLEAAGPLGDADEAGPAAAPADEAATPWATDLTPTAAADAPAVDAAADEQAAAARPTPTPSGEHRLPSLLSALTTRQPGPTTPISGDLPSLAEVAHTPGRGTPATSTGGAGEYDADPADPDTPGRDTPAGGMPKMDPDEEHERMLAVLQPEPVHREPDPVVHGLADMIVRSTPITGMAAVRSTSAEVPLLTPTPAANAPAAHAPAAGTPATGTPTAEKAATPPAGTPQVTAVEAELNRLAYVPDAVAEADPGPVDLPQIAVNDTAAAAPGAAAASSAPALSLSNSEIYAARASAAAATQRRVAYSDFAPAAAPVRRRRKRHVFRRLITFVILLGLVAGGLFAVKKYVLDARWDKDVEPLADAVSTARGLGFDSAVKVDTLPVAEYSVALASTGLGLDPDGLTVEQIASEWRALGLLNGALDLETVGMAAMPFAPAFYDPATGRISVMEGLPEELHTFALQRALAMALLDQEYGWGARLEGASPAVRTGILALYDADAVATVLGMTSTETQEALVGQLYALYSDYSIVPSPSAYGSALSGRLGVAAWPLFRGLDDTTRASLLLDAAPVDAQVLDLRGLLDGAAPSAAANANGVLFWYHVLAARIDDDLAWRAALTWRGDAVSLLDGGTHPCVAAMFQAGAEGDVAQAAFQQWAALASAESATSVTASANELGVALTINACDPGVAVPTSDGSPVPGLGEAPLRSEVLRLLIEQDPTLDLATAACAAASVGSLSMADERGVLDPVGGWTAPAAHGLPDPVVTGCLAPPAEPAPTG